MIRFNIDWRCNKLYCNTLPKFSENQQWSLNEVKTKDDLFLLMILICHINYVEL